MNMRIDHSFFHLTLCIYFITNGERLCVCVISKDTSGIHKKMKNKKNKK